MARSTSNSSSPRIRCRPGSVALTRRSLHGAPTPPWRAGGCGGSLTAPARAADRYQATSPSSPPAPADRNHRRRHSATAMTVAPPTSTSPAQPEGTGTAAAGSAAPVSATRNSHHSSGPVNRINNPRPTATPDTGRGRGAEQRDRRNDRGHSQIGEHTDQAQPPRDGRDQRRGHQLRGQRDADAVGQRLWDAAGRQPGRPGRRQDDQRSRRRHRQGESHVHRELRRRDHQRDDAGRQHRMAWRRRPESTANKAIAPITAARSTLALGCTTTTNNTSAAAASVTAGRGPITRAHNSTAPHTIVTLAPTPRSDESARRSGTARPSRGDRRGVPEHQPGRIAA